MAPLRNETNHPHRAGQALARRFGWLMALSLGFPLGMAPGAIAQNIVDGLPPAPLPPSQPSVAPSTPSVTVPPLNQAPGPTAQPTASSFVVVVDGDSPLLLSQIQQVDPSASLVSLEGRSLIQAGIFQSELDAAQRVQLLASRGIGSRVVAAVPMQQPTPAPLSTAAATPVEGFPIPDLPTTTVPRELEFQPLDTNERAPTPFDPEEESQRAYYIVIPGSDADLYDIRQQVIRLAHGFRLSRLVEERDSPLGPHVLVGPFSGRGAAERWNRYFADFGLEARVYFRR